LTPSTSESKYRTPQGGRGEQDEQPGIHRRHRIASQLNLARANSRLSGAFVALCETKAPLNAAGSFVHVHHASPPPGIGSRAKRESLSAEMPGGRCVRGDAGKLACLSIIPHRTEARSAVSA